MNALDKLKAYFGMVPADAGYGEYDDYPDEAYRRGHDDGYDDLGEPDVGPGRRVRATYRAAEREPVEAAARGRAEPAVAGALAMQRQPEPVTRLRPVADQSRGRDLLCRIVTLHPTGYAEARDIGEHFRDGNPVIMNLTEMANPDAKRLVDFAAGLAFALHGAMDKVTNKVFLLSPPDVDVSEQDRRRIAEDGLFLRR